MRIKLRFLGAAGNVTGSQYLLEANGSRILVDCGMYQERGLKDRNWEPFRCSPDSLDAVLLTHAHVDHCGLLPKLVRDGFKGKIYCTTATADIAEIILLDSAKIQEEDAEFKKKRHQREGRAGTYPEIPLYTVADAGAVPPLFAGVGYRESVEPCEGVRVTFHDAGHVLGSSMIEVVVKQGGEERIIIFSGDVGSPYKPILRDPTFFEEADYILTGGAESLTNCPHSIWKLRFGLGLGKGTMHDTLWDGLVDTYCNLGMGATAEKLAHSRCSSIARASASEPRRATSHTPTAYAPSPNRTNCGASQRVISIAHVQHANKAQVRRLCRRRA